MRLPTATAVAATLLALTACGTPTAQQPGRPSDRDVVRALADHAVPAADLAAVADAVGDADVVGVGELSHGAHEAFVFRQDLFEVLVERHGFRTFALEVSWGTGLLLDDHVVHGRGDLGAVMDRELQGQYALWNTEEYVDLLRWMRRWNLEHPDAEPLRFVGTDLGFPGRTVFDRLARDVERAAPARSAELERLTAPLRPATGDGAGAWMAGRLAADPAAREADADRARRLQALVADALPDDALAQQHARAIAQTFTGYAFTDDRFADRMRYRDRVLAANLLWWQRHHDGGAVLASSNTHVGYLSDDPETFPVPAGAHLGRALGEDYAAVGSTAGSGSIHALPAPTGAGDAGTSDVHDIGRPGPGSTERLLEQARDDDLVVDLRTLPGPVRERLAEPRPLRTYGLYWADGAGPDVSLARTFDVVVHLRHVTPGHLR